jgi:predicted MFS family arabinose efflux permease
MVCTIVGSVGGVLSSRLVKKYGAMETMLITHIPASITIILIPIMPTKTLTILIMLIRFSTGNMNICARQTYVTTLVKPD